MMDLLRFSFFGAQKQILDSHQIGQAIPPFHFPSRFNQEVSQMTNNKLSYSTPLAIKPFGCMLRFAHFLISAMLILAFNDPQDGRRALMLH